MWRCTWVVVALLIGGCTSGSTAPTTSTTVAEVSTSIVAEATSTSTSASTVEVVTPSGPTSTFEAAPPSLPSGPDLVGATITATTADDRVVTAEFFMLHPVLVDDVLAPVALVDCDPRLVARTSTAAYVPFKAVILADGGAPTRMSLTLSDGFNVHVLIASPAEGANATCSVGGQNGLTVESFAETTTMSGWFMVPDVVSPNAPDGAMSRLVDHTIAVSLDLGDGARDVISGRYGVPVDFFAGSRQALRIYLP